MLRYMLFEIVLVELRKLCCHVVRSSRYSGREKERCHHVGPTAVRLGLIQSSVYLCFPPRRESVIAFHSVLPEPLIASACLVCFQAQSKKQKPALRSYRTVRDNAPSNTRTAGPHTSLSVNFDNERQAHSPCLLIPSSNGRRGLFEVPLDH